MRVITLINHMRLRCVAPIECPENSIVVYLVMQNRVWSTGSDDVGLIQSTKAPILAPLHVRFVG